MIESGAKEVGEDAYPMWVRGEAISEWAAEINWDETAVLAHNAQFDVTILSWRYGIQPAFIFDTLSMARALRGVEVGNSLAKLASDFGLPPKGQAVHSTDGMLDAIPEEVEAELAAYCAHDTVLCEEIFKRLSPGFPTKELRLIDLTLKMYTRPMLELDKNMLAQAIIEEKTNREDLLQRLGVEEAALASNEKFAQILEGLGVEPPTKISKTTGKETLALAKNDALFQALLNSEREDIALLCEARLRVKSTSERTRAQRFLDIAHRGRLPVPLSYYGAATGRWTASKGSAINMQNLKRGSFLRKAIMASTIGLKGSVLEKFQAMRAAGFDAVVDSRELAVVGLVEILSHLPAVYRSFQRLIRAAGQRRPVRHAAPDDSLESTGDKGQPHVHVDDEAGNGHQRRHHASGAAARLGLGTAAACRARAAVRTAVGAAVRAPVTATDGDTGDVGHVAAAHVTDGARRSVPVQDLKHLTIEDPDVSLGEGRRGAVAPQADADLALRQERRSRGQGKGAHRARHRGLRSTGRPHAR